MYFVVCIEIILKFLGFDVKKSLLKFIQAFVYTLYKLNINKNILPHW
jgi:hypothetical protein